MPAYSVSTVTAVSGCAGVTTLSLRAVFDALEPRSAENGPAARLVALRYLFPEAGELHVKGTWPATRSGVRKARVAGPTTKHGDANGGVPRGGSHRFNNQVTFAVADAEDATRTSNVKLFFNGNMQLSGAKSVEQARAAMADVASLVSCVVNAAAHAATAAATACAVPSSGPPLHGFRVCLINTDKRLGFHLKRDKLYAHLARNHRDIICSYEPCIYSGVKIKYAWNAAFPDGKGVCSCAGRCDGCGDGLGDGDCRHITIAVFRSGCVIVTGARSYEQLNAAYTFVERLMAECETVVRSDPLPRLTSRSGRHHHHDHHTADRDRKTE